MEYILGVDPGRSKCGLAVVAINGACITRRVVPVTQVEEVAKELLKAYSPQVVVLGDRTGAEDFRRRIEQVLAMSGRRTTVTMIDEHRSSEEGRHRYLVDNRRGWRRFVPIGLQSPSRPFDDYVAEVLALRYLAKSTE